MKQAQFDKMNQELESIMEAGKDVADAVDIVALNTNLTLIDDTGDQCRIYQTVDDDLINCWLEGIEVGFDDQIEWYTDREEEEEEADDE